MESENFKGVEDNFQRYKENVSDLTQEFELDSRWINWNSKYERIELPISIVEEICDEIEIPCAQVEVHPTHERLEVGLVWLNNCVR